MNYYRHIPLSVEEHQQVVRKLCCRLEDLQPDEVPSLVHQVLLLTKLQHSMTLFFALKKYYNKLIYRLDDSSAVLDSTRLESVDSIGIYFSNIFEQHFANTSFLKIRFITKVKAYN